MICLAPPSCSRRFRQSVLNSLLDCHIGDTDYLIAREFSFILSGFGVNGAIFLKDWLKGFVEKCNSKFIIPVVMSLSDVF